MVTDLGKFESMTIGEATHGGRNTRGDSVISTGTDEFVIRVVKLEPRIDLPENGGSHSPFQELAAVDRIEAEAVADDDAE